MARDNPRYVEYADGLRKEIAAARTTLRERYGKDGALFEALPDLFLLVSRLAKDARVPWKQKLKLGGVVEYVISPVDLIPEAAEGAPGYADDLLLAAIAVKRVFAQAPLAVKSGWVGRGGVMEIVDRILKSGTRWVGSELHKRLRALF